MAKIITFGDEPLKIEKKLEKQNIVRIFVNSFNSLDRFTKLFFLTIALLALATPALVSGYFIIVQHASTGYIGTASSGTTGVTRNNQKFLNSYCPISSTYTNYNVDISVVSMFTLMNQYRASKGLPALTADVTLTNIAQWMANDMATNNYMSHTDSLGRSPQQRMSQMGYACWSWGEILAEGFGGDPSSTLTAWENSPEHNSIILGNYRAVGLYRAYNANSTYGWYWAGEFGSTIDKPATYIGVTPTPTPTPAPICLFNCTTPTPSPKPTLAPTATPTPASTGTCNTGQTGCGNRTSSPTGIYPYYTTYGTTQICSGGILAGNPNGPCPTGYYCALTAVGTASCVSGCTQRGYTCASSCSTSNIIPSGTNGYSCPSGGICCSGSVVGASATPTPTPTPITSSCVWGYQDNDRDGYGTGAYGCYTGGVSSLAGDCCDSDSRAHPGQTSAFTSPDNCGSFDYNCNGSSQIVGTYYALSGLSSSVRLNCVGGTCGSCTNGNFTPPYLNSYTTACGQPGGVSCTYAYFNPGLTYCPASGNATYRAGCTSAVTACN